MSRIFTSIILFITMLFSGGKMQNTDDIDGGVVTRDSGEDSPKVVKSSEIVNFDCEFSFLSASFDEESELAGKIYKMNAALEDDMVKVKLCCHDRNGNADKSEFETDASFMIKLQTVVSEHNLAQYNGFVHRVSGLPDMYGERIDVEYASGESIYAFDNQSDFLPKDAVGELIELFYSFETDT